VGISVIIPVAKDDEAWRSLLPDLRYLTKKDEVILVSNKSLQDEFKIEAEKLGLSCGTQWALSSSSGRAKQLNTGARSAKCDFFWFLHCDSNVNQTAIEKLRKSTELKPTAIHFFDLKFLRDGPWLTVSNGYGVWLRSHILRLPFGDQGYCMHRDVFAKLGGFCENVPYGEDHLLIWKAHQSKIKVCCVRAPIYTSARRYCVNGWFKTTARHLTLTIRQAAPEFIRLLKGRTII